MARPTKCTPELIEKICSEIINGGSIEAACGASGIRRRTLQRWKVKARCGEEPFKGFVRALFDAVGKAVLSAEQNIAKAGRWESSARWLESMRPKRWRRTERREVAHTGDIRFSWPDLAKSGPSMAEKRAAAVDEALRKVGRN